MVVYKCEYCGKLINSAEECAKHEQWHRNIEYANDMLSEGATLEQIDQRYGIWNGVPEHLKEVTKDHCFVISYWQCCDKPAYQIKRIELDGRLHIRGCGSWSGYFGGEVRIGSGDLRKVHQPGELYIDPRHKERWGN